MWFPIYKQSRYPADKIYFVVLSLFMIVNTESQSGSCESGKVIVECTYRPVEFSMHGKSTRYWRGMCFNINRFL